jgi:TRAF3-interacting protein 1
VALPAGAATPLAKIMDYLGEDIDNMAKEHRFWVTEKKVYNERLIEESRMAGDNLQGEAQIADLDGQIKQSKDRIMGNKAQILRNDESISKLLTMAVSG